MLAPELPFPRTCTYRGCAADVVVAGLRAGSAFVRRRATDADSKLMSQRSETKPRCGRQRQLATQLLRCHYTGRGLAGAVEERCPRAGTSWPQQYRAKRELEPEVGARMCRRDRRAVNSRVCLRLPPVEGKRGGLLEFP
jgi:hypothetical protein